MDWDRLRDGWPMAAHSRFVLCKPHRWHVQEAGAGPTVLLLHGAGGATQSWRHVFPLLTPDFHVIAVDLPGQGFTRLGARQRCGVDEMAEDLAALCAQEGWRPDAIVGHSAGAALALRLAEILPVPRIVGINAALAPFEGVAGVLFPVLAKALSLVPLVPDVFAAANARDASVRRLIEGTGSTLDDEGIRLYRQLVGDRDHVDATLQMMAQWDLSGLLRRLPEHPSAVLLLAAERDRTVPPDTSRKAAARLRHGSCAPLPGLGHLAHEEDAARVLAPVRAFLAGEGGPQPRLTDAP